VDVAAHQNPLGSLAQVLHVVRAGLVGGNEEEEVAAIHPLLLPLAQAKKAYQPGFVEDL